MPLVFDLISPVKQVLRKCPDETIRQHYVRAARTLLGRSRWYLSPLIAPLVAGESTYSLGDDAQLEIISVDMAQVHLPGGFMQSIRPTQAWNFNPNHPEGTPLWYAYVPEGAVMFHPVPDQAYTVTLSLALQPRETATELDDFVLTKWRRAFDFGALSTLYAIVGEPWFSAEMSVHYDAKFEKLVSDAQIDRERGYQHGSMRARQQPFIARG